MQSDRARTSSRTARRGLLGFAVVAVVCVLLSLAFDPGSGTGTNFQAADDVAGLVIGAHHAKPVPTSGVALLSVLLLVVAAAAIVAVTPTDASWVVRRPRCDVDDPRHSLVAPSGRAWRAPPAAVSV